MLGTLLLTPILWTGIIQVSIVDFSFSPDSVYVQPGDTVRWTQNDGTPHTSTGIGTGTGAWDSGDLLTGETYQRVFGTPGTFDYRCDIHQGMLGKVTVAGPVPVIPANKTNKTPGPDAAGTEKLRDLRGRTVEPGKAPSAPLPLFTP